MCKVFLCAGCAQLRCAGCARRPGAPGGGHCEGGLRAGDDLRESLYQYL